MKPYKKYLQEMLELCKDMQGISSYKMRKFPFSGRERKLRKLLGNNNSRQSNYNFRCELNKYDIFEIYRYSNNFLIVVEKVTRGITYGSVINLNKFTKISLLLKISKVCFWGLERILFIYRGLKLMK